MRKYVIFDFDGTLADAKRVVFETINALAERYGFPKLEENQMNQMKNVSTESYQLIASDFYALYKKSMHKITLFDGMKDVLQVLEEHGIGIAVISSNEESNIREYFASQQIECIQEVYTSSDLYGKDRMIDDFCARHQLRKQEVLYVGDELRDIAACKRSGVDIVWVNWGYATEAEAAEANPTYFAYKPHDIVKYALQQVPSIEA
ncbi:MAG: HAD-IA family hydrolase [Bacillus sp. (in: firmicutes)]